MELKSDKKWVKVHQVERFNRTFMELKFRSHERECQQRLSF